MNLLEFARGPGMQAAAAICALGLCWRLFHLFFTTPKTDLSAPRRGGARSGGLRAILSRFRHHPEFRARARNGSILAYTMHIGLAVLFFGAAPHILFIESTTGISWASLPPVVIHIAAAATLAALLVAAGRRLQHPVLRMISNFDDYFTMLVTALPVVTGILAAAHVGARYETLLGLHVLSFDLFLAWFPLGKLMHAFLVFGSRYTTGYTFSRRGARV